MSLNKNNIIYVMYLCSIITISALPSGNFFFVNIKMIAFFVLVLSFLYFFLKVKFKFSKVALFFSCFLLCLLLFYTLYGLFNFIDTPLEEFKLMFLSIFIGLISYVFYSHLVSIELFFKAYTYIIIVIFLIKFIAYTQGDMALAYRYYSMVFNTHVITMSTPFDFYRLYLLTDILAVFYPFVLSWGYKKRYITKSAFYSFILVLSTLLVLSSFSRYLMFVFICGFLMYLYICRLKKIKLLFLFLFLFFILLIFYDDIYTLIQLRFFSHINGTSDATRKEQAFALFKMFLEQPFFGFGIGAYTIECIRSPLKFGYELQLMSLFVKFGTIGMTILFGYVFYALYRFLHSKNFIGIFTIVFFMGASLFNPYLFSSCVSILYTFIFLMLKDIPKTTNFIPNNNKNEELGKEENAL
jgi:hypothetical protein